MRYIKRENRLFWQFLNMKSECFFYNASGVFVISYAGKKFSWNGSVHCVDWTVGEKTCKWIYWIEMNRSHLFYHIFFTMDNITNVLR